MITKTLNLDSAYQALFDEVREKSGGAINVNNLEAFFGSITEIAALDSKFLRLPLDEPLFEIDANSRKIAVPAEFRSNGASVQGDHLAEVIFFRIERYFDYKDLSTCNIEINWKMGSKEGKTTRFIKFDDVQTIDEVKSNCIIFGWPINDVVTEKSGALTFAVEFNQTEGEGDNQKIIYRFNTLPTTINIKDGLILSEDVEAVELDTDILRTLVNSSFGEGTAAVGDLVWLTGDGSGLVVGEDVDGRIILRDFAATINLPTVIEQGVPQSAPVSLFAEGYVDEGTEIQYTDANNIPVGSNDPVSAVSLEMLPVNRPLVLVEDRENLSEDVAYFNILGERVTDLENFTDDLFTQEALVEGLKYYVAGDTADSYPLASPEQVAAWGTADMVDLYLKVAKVVASDAGVFVIRGQGYKMGADADNPEIHKIGSGEVKSTALVTVPSVEAPSEVLVEVPELVLPVPEEGSKGSYSLVEGVENIIFITANNGEEQQDPQEEAGIPITASAVVDSFGALQFNWKKKVGDSAEFVNASEQEAAFQDTNSSELRIVDAGEYKVSVVNFLNSAMAPAVESAVVIATELAGKITDSCISLKYNRKTNSGEITREVVGDLTYNSADSMQKNWVKLIADVDTSAIEGPVGDLEYQWFKRFVDSQDDEGQDLYRYEPINGATASIYEVRDGNSGYFVPVVKNKYNGSIYSYQADVINVIDSAHD